MTQERITVRLEAQVGERLKLRHATICTAESCTGGLVASLLTDIPGSSAYVLGGVVAYSNAVKHALLSVPDDILMEQGAVSAETAAVMASSARALFGADYALSVTGIAGPGGETPTKPVGLTYIGIAGPSRLLEIRRFVWKGDREANKRSSAEAALRLALEYV
ncbi:MAG: CinA family protein [bacterium]|nr:CinA family protein [bacterium]